MFLDNVLKLIRKEGGVFFPSLDPELLLSQLLELEDLLPELEELPELNLYDLLRPAKETIRPELCRDRFLNSLSECFDITCSVNAALCMKLDKPSACLRTDGSLFRRR